MNRNVKNVWGALAIVGFISTAGAIAADREPESTLLAQATPAPKATEETPKPQTAGDKHASHPEADAAAAKGQAMEDDEKEMAKQMQMMGKQMRERGMHMHKQGMTMEKNGAPKGMNMEKMDMDMDAMEKELMEDDKDMEKMEMNMDNMDKNMGHR